MKNLKNKKGTLITLMYLISFFNSHKSLRVLQQEIIRFVIFKQAKHV